MASYSYDDYRKKAEESGYAMSDADNRLAMRNPDAGMSLLTYKYDYDNAPNDSARALAHANAEEIRRRYGSYSGGGDGSGFALVTDNPQYESAWDERIGESYKNMEKPFAYTPETDPNTRYYRAAYEREGRKAFENALGTLAARTGGNASSYAATAAAQAQNSYMQELTDKYPELYQQAYNNFLSEYQRNAQNAQAYQSQDAVEYGRFLDDRNNELQRKQMQAAADQQAWENAYSEKKLDADIRQTDAELDYKLKALDQDKQQQVMDLAYKYAALQENGRQADAEMEYKYAALTQSEKELVQNLAYKYAALEEDKASAEMERAVKAAEYGDFSLLENLGIDPSMYRAYLYEQMGMEVPEEYSLDEMSDYERERDLVARLAGKQAKDIAVRMMMSGSYGS